jgi:hypothetical protein
VKRYEAQWCGRPMRVWSRLTVGAKRAENCCREDSTSGGM